MGNIPPRFADLTRYAVFQVVALLKVKTSTITVIFFLRFFRKTTDLCSTRSNFYRNGYIGGLAATNCSMSSKTCKKREKNHDTPWHIQDHFSMAGTEKGFFHISPQNVFGIYWWGQLWPFLACSS